MYNHCSLSNKRFPFRLILFSKIRCQLGKTKLSIKLIIIFFSVLGYCLRSLLDRCSCTLRKFPYLKLPVINVGCYYKRIRISTNENHKISNEFRSEVYHRKNIAQIHFIEEYRIVEKEWISICKKTLKVNSHSDSKMHFHFNSNL